MRSVVFIEAARDSSLLVTTEEKGLVVSRGFVGGV